MGKEAWRTGSGEEEEDVGRIVRKLSQKSSLWEIEVEKIERYF